MALNYPLIKLSLDIQRRLEEAWERMESFPDRAAGKSTCFKMKPETKVEVTVCHDLGLQKDCEIELWALNSSKNLLFVSVSQHALYHILLIYYSDLQ